MRDLDSFSFSGSLPPVCIGEGEGVREGEVVISMGILFCCRKICNCLNR